MFLAFLAAQLITCQGLYTCNGEIPEVVVVQVSRKRQQIHIKIPPCSRDGDNVEVYINGTLKATSSCHVFNGVPILKAPFNAYRKDDKQ